jgi:2-polyprenyl-6-methoxyphenol hydroxylase-like FAD-dependent oxidoreductase
MQVGQIIDAMDHTFRWGIYNRAPQKTWSTDRITLSGDSAHAVTPHLGQGANQAVEDANDRLELDTYDPERIAKDAFAEIWQRRVEIFS